MATQADIFSLKWGQLGAGVTAVGALGTAAFGVVESFGKAFAFTWTTTRPQPEHNSDRLGESVSPRVSRDIRIHHWGLPYIGLSAVKRMIEPLRPALRCAYGDDFSQIIAEQYRADRSQGSARDTIRQGVRLGLPFLEIVVAQRIIASVWHMDPERALELATALQPTSESTPPNGEPSSGPASAGASDQIQALAGRFSTALDARISAAFELAEEQYQTVAKTAAGGVALALAGVFNWGLSEHFPGHMLTGVFPWPVALGIGLVAVPLAPVAKDLSTSLQNALTAFKTIASKP